MNLLQIAGADVDDAELSASVATDWLELGDAEGGNVHWTGYAINLAWTGAGIGSFSLEVANAGNADYAVALPQTAETADGSPIMFNVTDAKYRLVRLRYTRTSGTITLTAIAVRK